MRRGAETRRWNTSLNPRHRRQAGSRAAFGDAVRQGLSGKTDPDVATLNLLDAEYALSVGRFREAVLLCWGAIDSTFVRKFKHWLMIACRMNGLTDATFSKASTLVCATK